MSEECDICGKVCMNKKGLASHKRWHTELKQYDNFRENYVKNVTGKNNVHWKGEKVSYSGMHHWLEDHKPKPDICEICGKKESPTGKARLVLSNKDHKYNRNNFEDWQWVHHYCHIHYDKKLRGDNHN